MSPSGFLGHLAYLLLVISMVMRRLLWLRIFVVLSAVAGICYAIFILTDPVSVFWETTLITVNMLQLGISAWQNSRARFSPDERRFMDEHFAGLPTGQQRILLDLGQWSNLAAGTVLCTEGAAVPALYYLSSGQAAVVAHGKLVGVCASGTFVGEISVSTSAPASATVTLTEPGLLWQIETARLRSLMEHRPQIANALKASFFVALCDKLLRTNMQLSVLAERTNSAVAIAECPASHRTMTLNTTP